LRNWRGCGSFYAQIVRLNWKCRNGFGRTAKTVLSTLLLLQMLFLLVLVACPALHHALHHDSNSSEHQCAVTLFAHGQADMSAVAAAAVIPVVPVAFLPLTSASVFNALVATLPPGRGPPVSLLHS
jgi:hypothetical protein